MLSVMRYVTPGSLSQTFDAVNTALFFRRPIPQTQVQKAGVFIASRLGLPGAYAGTFALFPHEIADGDSKGRIDIPIVAVQRRNRHDKISGSVRRLTSRGGQRPSRRNGHHYRGQGPAPRA